MGRKVDTGIAFKRRSSGVLPDKSDKDKGHRDNRLLWSASLVHRKWTHAEDLKEWRPRLVKALDKLARKPPKWTRKEPLDVAVDDIRVPSTFEAIDAMVDGHAKAEARQLAAATQREHDLRRLQMQRLAAAEGEEDLGEEDGAETKCIQVLEAEAGGQEEVPIKSSDDVTRDLLEQAPTASAWWLERIRSEGSWTDYVRANTSCGVMYTTSGCMVNPHAWWTQRLMPRGVSHESVRQRVAKRNEIVITVVVCNSVGFKEQEFDVLASQKLYELRDAFYFASDWMYDGPTRLQSASFYIDGIFYSDRRHSKALDYSKEIIAWMKSTRRPVRCEESKSMDIRFSELDRIPFGEKCSYIHQGDVEHSVYFTNARLLGSHEDCPFRAAYPVLTFMRRFGKRRCYACTTAFATWVVLDSSRCPHNPSFWCSKCFRQFYQDAEGNFVPPVDYKVFPYLHEDSLP